MRNNLDKILRSMAKNGNSFTIDTLYRKTHIKKEILWVILDRLKEKGLIESIEKGKYIIIPLNAEKGKYTLHEFIIGSLLVKPYAISYWSALNFYGFTEQIPTTVFIQTTSRKKRQEKIIFGVKYKIVRIKEEKFFGIRSEQIEESKINITTKEKTIIDCLDKPQYCGGITEVIKAFRNGKSDIDRKILKEYAIRINNGAVIRRLGYICDKFKIKIKLPKPNTRNYVYLDPTMPKEGKKNAKWRIIINVEEYDLLND